MLFHVFQNNYLVFSRATVKGYKNVKKPKPNTLTKQWYCSSIKKKSDFSLTIYDNLKETQGRLLNKHI